MKPAADHPWRRSRNLLAEVQREKTHCPQGHPYDEENTRVIVSSKGTARRCRACKAAKMRRVRRRTKLTESPEEKETRLRKAREYNREWRRKLADSPPGDT